MSEIPPAVFSACIAAWCEAIKATALLAQHWPVTPPTAVPSSSQLPSTPVAAVHETVRATQVASPERQEVVEVERPMRIAVTFYLYEVPGEIKLIPGASTCIKLPPIFIIGNLNQFVKHKLFPGLPRNVDFEPLTTDKFYFAVTMTRIAGRKLRLCGSVDSTTSSSEQ